MLIIQQTDLLTDVTKDLKVVVSKISVSHGTVTIKTVAGLRLLVLSVGLVLRKGELREVLWLLIWDVASAHVLRNTTALTVRIVIWQVLVVLIINTVGGTLIC